MRNPLRGWNPDTEIHKTLQEFRGLLNTLRQVVDAPQNVKGIIMALQADVQRLVDEVARNTSASQSMKQSFDLQSSKLNDQNTQIMNLQNQIKDLVAQQQSGQPVDAEDLAAIQDSANKVKANNDTLQEITAAVSTAAPANVPDQPPQVIPGGATTPPPAGPTSGATGTPGDTSVPAPGMPAASPAPDQGQTAPSQSAPNPSQG